MGEIKLYTGVPIKYTVFLNFFNVVYFRTLNCIIPVLFRVYNNFMLSNTL